MEMNPSSLWRSAPAVARVYRAPSLGAALAVAPEPALKTFAREEGLAALLGRRWGVWGNDVQASVANALVAEQATRRAICALEDEGIPVVVLKGVVAARLGWTNRSCDPSRTSICWCFVRTCVAAWRCSTTGA